MRLVKNYSKKINCFTLLDMFSLLCIDEMTCEIAKYSAFNMLKLCNQVVIKSKDIQHNIRLEVTLTSFTKFLSTWLTVFPTFNIHWQYYDRRNVGKYLCFYRQYLAMISVLRNLWMLSISISLNQVTTNVIFVSLPLMYFTLL